MLQPSVAAEFIGMARAFRARFAASDPTTSKLIDQIVLPIRARIEQHPTPRAEALASAAREWRTKVPAHGRLALSIDHKRTRLTIEETRVSASTFGRTEWEDREPGVAVMHMQIRIAPRLFDAEMTTIAGLSLHALARRFQKAWRGDDAAIFVDLCALAAAWAELVQRPDGSDFQVRTADGGVWAGSVANVTTGGRAGRILLTRTYLAQGEIAR
jgi:hypothetical protein